MDVSELLGFKAASSTPQRSSSSSSSSAGLDNARKRSRFSAMDAPDAGGAPPILQKKMNLSSLSSQNNHEVDADEGMDISEEERLKILKMVEEEPEAPPLDETSLKRMISVLEKRISRNQEMRIKFPDQAEKFMDSELELHESVQELHALATIPDLYPVTVDLNLSSILLGLLSHENADISCAVLDLFQEITDVDTINENEEATSVFIDNLLDQQAISLLTQNLDRLDETHKDESDGVHNTLAIFENLFEIRPELCAKASQNGLLQWLLKRLKARMPFDGNKLYAAESLAILLQNTPENRQALGEIDGIDILLQQLAFYKRHDPSSNEESEYMENLFNCLCSSLLWGPNREKFLKGEGPQLMNLMLKEKKQSRNGSLKVLNHAVSGPEGLENANKIIEILGLRTIFPLFMKTPKKTKRKGLTALEHEEHVISILAGLLQHGTGGSRSRILIKFEENDFEKLERLVELHFKYLEKVQTGDREMNQSEEFEGLDDDEIYLRRLDNGLFTLQLIDYIIVEVSAASSKIKDRLLKLLQLRKGSFNTIVETVNEYAENIGDENQEWKSKQQENIKTLLETLQE